MTKRLQSHLSETTLAYEKHTGPSRLLFNFAMEGMEFSHSYRIPHPFVFNQVGFVTKLKAAINLFTHQPKRWTRLSGC
jgi:hypothetical protein